jgi:hypothetical protein
LGRSVRSALRDQSVPSQPRSLPAALAPPPVPSAPPLLREVHSAAVLGVVVGADEDRQDSAMWQARLAAVQVAFGKLSRLRSLSAFGRGMGSAAYGVSLLLYAAEFSGEPPAEVCASLQHATSVLVDRAGDARRFAGVRADLLVGRPADGGFGAMPWAQHVRARHAQWAARLVVAPHADVPPWVCIARVIMRRLCPWWGPLAMFACDPDLHRPDAGAVPPPPPLRRLIRGLQALPEVRDIVAGVSPLRPGAWCANAPLWGNPLAPGSMSVGGPHLLFTLGTLHTVGDALCALHAAADSNRWRGPGGEQHFLRSHAAPAWLRGRLEFHRLLQGVVDALPVGWADAARSALAALPAGRAPGVPPGVPSVHAVEAMLIARLGWRVPPRGRDVHVAGLTVKAATQLQLAPVLGERATRQLAFVREAFACAPGGGVLLAPRAQFVRWQQVPVALRMLWKLRWDNAYKEVYWRLLLDALPTYRRMHQLGRICVCGSACPGREHHYWHCCVAQAVVQELRLQLPPPLPGVAQGLALGGAADLLCEHVWLMRPPRALVSVHRGVWRVVCLAALHAMDMGRRRLYAIQIAAEQGDGGPTAALPVERQLSVVSRAAVAHFWGLLADFVAVDAAPPQWLAQIGPSHPFLCVDVARTRVLLNGPM